ncbi:outer membrane protein assembly factor BamA [Jiella sp. MQZ9-1]|uniref:Outer membrane protein assembly factor BamA n=1 Tax=Jiella flava TaxID=2816857 RepID=A0A939JVE0_9HYPH|nr:outer membrane protein assembly factor BamA [Jiella flava]MBO0662359.1 outer membrane protein assembly factor BamA [Jiella flava]MCD2470811.1 outer membrane protein assembly factor BamA [Jiella flava]
MTAGTKILRAATAIALSSTVLATTALTVQLASVTAASAATVSRIVVRGNSRVDADTIRGFMQIKPGQNVTAADQDAAVRRLYSTGLFSNVRVSQSGSTLTVQVDENEVVNQVLFQGNSKLKDKQLMDAVQTAPRGAYSKSIVDADVDAIKKAYTSIGRSDAVVTPQIQQIGKGQVNVIFNIQEGDRTKIASISFVGNKAFGDSRLKHVIALRESGLLSFIQRDDVYDPQRLDADEETLRKFYYNHGYADFRILSAVAELDPKQNSYYITITVDEGERYTFGKITIDSTIEGVDTQSLYSDLDTTEGEVYSAKEVEDTLVNLTNALANKGFAFAQVTPRGNRDFANHTIAIDYVIDQGPRVYVERIEIRGNTKTRDYVIRREFDIAEGDAFNQVLIQRAKQRLEDLKYFNTVKISTAPGSEPDRVIVIVDVNEKPTGEISVGGGYTTSSESSGPVAEVGIQERNFLGRGQFIKVSAGLGTNSRSYQLSFTEPYFLGQRLAAGFDVYHTKTTGDDYDVTRTGGDVRLAAPITDHLTAQVAYNYKRESYGDSTGLTVINPSDTSTTIKSTCGDPNPQNNLNDKGGNPIKAPSFTNSPIINQAICNSPYSTSSVSYSLTYNTLDNNQDPRDGFKVQAGQEFAGLGGDARYIKTTGKATYFNLLSEEYDVIGQLSGGAGNVMSLGSGGLRVFDNFFKGEDIVRGFDSRGIGPRQYGVAIGGRDYANVSAEATFPLPGINRDLGFRGAVFADAGSLWDSEYAGQPGVVGTDFAVRASAGVGLIWASPFGPLRVNYAYPLKKEKFDDTQQFSFGFSSRF